MRYFLGSVVCLLLLLVLFLYLNERDGAVSVPRRQGPFLPLDEVHPITNKSIAFVTSIFGDYDDPPVIPKHLHHLSFFVFCDKLLGKHPPWKRITTPYWKMDKEVDAGFKNSFSVNKDPSTITNMMSKYYKYFAWRIPELRGFQYVVYVDSNVVCDKANHLPQKIRGLFDENPGIDFFIQKHQWNKDIMVEAGASMQQPRYARDRVTEQAKLYVDNYRFPYEKADLYWVGIFIYRTQSLPLRKFFFDVFRECQLWSMEDQVVVPFMMWKNKIESKVQGMTDMCSRILENTATTGRPPERGMMECNRLRFKGKAYGT